MRDSVCILTGRGFFDGRILQAFFDASNSVGVPGSLSRGLCITVHTRMLLGVLIC